jgi:hypothetical protein
MKEFLTTRALGLLLPLIVGPLAYLLTKLLKDSVTAIDKAPPYVKQAIVVALSFALAGAVKYFGSLLPGVCVLGDDPMSCLSALTNPDAMKVLVSALVAFAIHAGQKAQDAK